jgi:hypothetical protein
VLRGIFVFKRDEVTGEWRKRHNEELHDKYSSPTIVRVIKSRSMRWAGHIAPMRVGRGMYRVLVGKPEGKKEMCDASHTQMNTPVLAADSISKKHRIHRVCVRCNN